MIRIVVGIDQLRTRIDQHAPGWLARSATKTSELESDPNVEITSAWSAVKQVFMDMQYSKCIFCEKEIENQPAEHDVEHFRPKNRVTRWVAPNWMIDDEGVLIAQPDTGTEPGYRLLAYHFLNYAAACRTCNSTRKRDYFPIAAALRKSSSKNPSRMKTEKAYLIYPIGDIDEDPETLIEFEALSPRAKMASGFGRKRALVTIELFELERESLHKLRAKNIWILFTCLRQMQNGNPTERAEAKRVADHMTSEKHEHTNCLRSFRRLCEADFARAESLAQAALQLWITGSP